MLGSPRLRSTRPPKPKAHFEWSIVVQAFRPAVVRFGVALGGLKAMLFT